MLNENRLNRAAAAIEQGETFGSLKHWPEDIREYLSSFEKLLKTKVYRYRNMLTYNQQTFLTEINLTIIKAILKNLLEVLSGRSGYLSLELGFLLENRDTGLVRLYWSSLNTSIFKEKLFYFGGNRFFSKIIDFLSKIDFDKITKNAFPDSVWKFLMVTNVHCRVLFRRPKRWQYDRQ